MSTKLAFEKLKREIAYKKIIVLEGNVLDNYFLNGEFFNLNETLVSELTKTKTFDGIYVWDRINGLTSDDMSRLVQPQAPKESGNPIEGIDDDVFETKNEVGKFKKPDEFFPILFENIKSSKRKLLFVINYSNYLFPGEQGLSDCDRENLTRVLKVISEQKLKMTGKDKNCSIIIVTPNISSIPISLYQNNPDAKIINIPLPDREERKEIVMENKDYFKLSNLSDKDKNILVDFVDSLDNFTTKEIIQIAILSHLTTETMTDTKLLSLFKFGKKESPWEKLDKTKVKSITEILSKRVKGQELSIQKVKDVVIRAKTGLSGLQHSKSKNKPKGVLFFAGPTGVGKTELAKSLAEFLFGDENSCIRFDMSEYNHEHSDQKLIGAPPGYVGYEAGGQLTNMIREKPFCVLLFDEIEKAHPKILDKFLQILEDGRLTDGKGETVYFSECIIIFTSNIGANKVNPDMDINMITKTINDAIKDKFENEINRPELLGRIGSSNIVTFDFITDVNVTKNIIDAKLKPVYEYLKDSKKLNFEIKNKDSFLKHVISQADKSKGGRDILNKLEDILITKLSFYLFENEEYIESNSTLFMNFEKNEISFYYE